VLLTEVSAEEAAELAEKVSHKHPIVLVSCVLIGSRIHIICFSADLITARHVLMNICCVFRILRRRCDENQLADAAMSGSADDVLSLLAEGADKNAKDEVRDASSLVYVHLLAAYCVCIGDLNARHDI
jgi:hypothetical protein